MISSRKRKWRYKSVSRPRRIKRLRKEDDDIQKFITWCKEVGIRISEQVYAHRVTCIRSCTSSVLFQVSITRRGSCANIGMVARRSIAEGTCLAKIPRTAVLSCTNSELHKIIKCDKKISTQLPQLTSWLPLILTLLYEQDRKVFNSYYIAISIVTRVAMVLS